MISIKYNISALLNEFIKSYEPADSEGTLYQDLNIFLAEFDIPKVDRDAVIDAMRKLNDSDVD